MSKKSPGTNNEIQHAEISASPKVLSPLYTKEKLELHRQFFEKLINELQLNREDADIVAVLHVLPDAIPFTEALAKIARIQSVIPKPKSINRDVIGQLDQKLITPLNRENIEDILDKIKGKTVFLDIGGYFSPIVPKLKERLGDTFCGIVEDTENGFQKYEENGIDFPFISVARSPLKENEDVMVGQAISYSAEKLLRQHCILVNGLNVGVIGFGKIGRSVAMNMRQKQAAVSINDINNVRLTHAVSSGFEVSGRKELLENSDVICLATGKISLAGEDYTRLKNGCWIFSVTSSDDELDLEWLKQNYTAEKISQYATRYTKDSHYFYLLNDGNAINFIHGTTVGDFILLVHAELLVSAHRLLTGQQPDGQHELDKETWDNICKIWLSVVKGIR